MSDVKVTIDNIEVKVPEGSTLLEAAHIAGVDIPTLCYLKDVNEIGACRMCLCEVRGVLVHLRQHVYSLYLTEWLHILIHRR